MGRTGSLGRTLANLAIVHSRLGAPDTARRLFLRARDLAKAADDVVQLAAAEAGLAGRLYDVGDYDGALELYHAAWNRLRDMAHHAWALRVANNLALCLCKTGRVEQARSVLTELRARVEPIGDASAYLTVTLNLAWVLSRLNVREEADALLDEAERTLGEVEDADARIRLLTARAQQAIEASRRAEVRG